MLVHLYFRGRCRGLYALLTCAFRNDMQEGRQKLRVKTNLIIVHVVVPGEYKQRRSVTIMPLIFKPS